MSSIDQNLSLCVYISMYLITTPIPYTNSEPHLGHLLEGVFGDTMRRFYTRVSTETVFLTMGVDQHGLKIYEKAVEEMIEPGEYVGELALRFKDLWEKYEVGYSEFVETSSVSHRQVAQTLWKILGDKDLIYKKSYTGLYCVGCEDFYAPSQLNEGKCPIHDSLPKEMQEENYFFRLTEFKEVIAAYLQQADIQPKYIVKEYTNFIEDLQDISISRERSRLPWGVAVPGDETQVMYVWFEALINYLTAVVNPETIDKLTEFPHLTEEFATEVIADLKENLPINLMYISKEIAKFHVVIFIAMLAGLDLPLPERVLAHGMITDSSGRKFSKSLGNGVTPEQMEEKFGVEGTRFLMLHEINIDGDTNFDWQTMTDAYNAHLANNIGNLVMRVTTLIEKFFDGVIELESVENPIYKFNEVYTHLHNLNPRDALEIVLEGARKGNEYLEQTAPWSLAKTDLMSTKVILTELAVLLRDLSVVLSIFLPQTGESIYQTITEIQIKKSTPLFMKVELEKNS
jgi:methionyl-tRNA synthetase